MKTTKIIFGVAVALALLAVGIVLFEIHEAHQRAAELALANQQRDSLNAKFRLLRQQMQAKTDAAQASVPAAVDNAAANAPITHDTVAAHYAHARELAKNGDYAGALAEFLWCYNQGMPQVPSYNGVRESFLLMYMARLGEQYPAALDALRALRDQAKYRILNDANDINAADDFSSINHVLNEGNLTMDLFDQLGPTDPRRAAMGPAVYDQLVANQRYTDAVQVMSYERISPLMPYVTQPDPTQPPRIDEVETAAQYVEVLAGSGDLTDARALADKILNYDNSDAAKAVLQSHLTRAGQPNLLNPQP